MRPRWILLLCCAVVLAACHEESPTGPEDAATPMLKKKCPSPPCGGGGEDPPPPPSVDDPAILYSSGIESNVGGGGCKRGDLQDSMYRMDLSGASERVFGDNLETQAHTQHPSFSPDGQRFAMYRDVYTVRKGRCDTEHFEIATAGVDGTGFTVIREIERGSGGLDQPRWSPGPVGGGERIAWMESTGDLVSLIIADTDGSSRFAVVEGTLTGEVEGFEWSRSGDAILVHLRDWGSDFSHLRLYSLNCASTCSWSSFVEIGDTSPITPGWFSEMDWARQHDWIAVSKCFGGDCDVYKIDITDPALPVVTQLTAGGSLDELEVSWSPDDSRILFVAGPIGSGERLVELDLTIVSLPWTGDLNPPGVRILPEVGPAGGTDWRRF